MGHIPTATVGALAAVLTGLYFVLPDAMHFTMTVFIVAAWFLTVICWLAQKSADYMHKYGSHSEIKKKLTESQPLQMVQISAGDLEQTKIQLSSDLEELQNRVEIKDKEIEKLKTEIKNLKTLVEIEALKAELANLKILAAQENSKRKKKK
ncbi:MAG TPA: hypothetical protein VLD38_02800 [Nitrosopumilaceae archaeon]|nr:hypothetical protein [Nitrosopumilaceae archaeon]